MITVAAGGSSSVFRNASDACRSSSRMAPMRMALAPREFVSGGVGTITCRSGCCRDGLPSSSAANASAVDIRPAPAGPTKAYAWATRSLASARRSRSTARGWSRMRSSSTNEVLDDRPHLGRDDGGRARRVDQPHALGLGAADLEIALAHSPVEGERFALEVVEPPSADPPQSLSRIEVEEQREVGHDAAGRTNVQLADQVGIDAAAVPLIGDRRVGVPVAEHDAAPVEPR